MEGLGVVIDCRLRAQRRQLESSVVLPRVGHYSFEDPHRRLAAARGLHRVWIFSVRGGILGMWQRTWRCAAWRLIHVFSGWAAQVISMAATSASWMQEAVATLDETWPNHNDISLKSVQVQMSAWQSQHFGSFSWVIIVRIMSLFKTIGVLFTQATPAGAWHHSKRAGVALCLQAGWFWFGWVVRIKHPQIGSNHGKTMENLESNI